MPLGRFQAGLEVKRQARHGDAGADAVSGARARLAAQQQRQAAREGLTD